MANYYVKLPAPGNGTVTNVAISSSDGSLSSSGGPISTTGTIDLKLGLQDLTVFVDFLNGNDSNSGSANSPWKTLQHAYNSINPSVNGPYVIKVSGGNNNTDTSPVTGKSNVSIVSDYGIQVPAITLPDSASNDGCTFVNLIFLGPLTWVKTGIWGNGVTFINCEFFSGPVIKNTSTGQCSVFATGSVFVNSEFQPANGGFGVFLGCTFLGTSAFDDPGTSGFSYLEFLGGYNSGTMTITGFYNAAYFSGFVHDTAFGAALTLVSGSGGDPALEIDSAGTPPTFTGSAVSTLLLSQAKNENYVATTATDWAGSSPATNVGSALDRIAAALNALGHKP